MVSTEAVEQVRTRAARGLVEARQRRKYCPHGPFSPVELVALRALAEVSRALDVLCAEGRQ